MIINTAIEANNYIKNEIDSESILLVEPYRIKYIPLGLFKLYTYFKNKAIILHFVTGKYRMGFDSYKTIFISSGEFSYHKPQVKRLIEYYINEYPKSKIIVGGVFVQGNTEFTKELDSLGCTVIASEIPIIDIAVDYSLCNYNLYNFVFTTRGCPMPCEFCYVTTVEPSKRIVDTWKEQILEPNLPNILIHDNNILAFGLKHFIAVTDVLLKANKIVVLDNGLDSRFWKKEHYHQLERLSNAGLLANTSLRGAFDNKNQDGNIQRMVKDFKKLVPGKESLIYVLINYDADIEECYYRSNEIVQAGGWPFLQYYAPLDFVGDPNEFKGPKYTPEFHILHDYFNYKIYKQMIYKKYKEEMKNES